MILAAIGRKINIKIMSKVDMLVDSPYKPCVLRFNRTTDHQIEQLKCFVDGLLQEIILIIIKTWKSQSSGFKSLYCSEISIYGH